MPPVNTACSAVYVTGLKKVAYIICVQIILIYRVISISRYSGFLVKISEPLKTLA